MFQPLLNVQKLNIGLKQGLKSVHLVKNSSFSIDPGETVVIVGESGSGKSLTAHALMGLLSDEFKVDLEYQFEGKKLDLSGLRGSSIGMIFQDPNSSLNPLLKIGTQLSESLCFHKKMTKKNAFSQSVKWLERVGISSPELRMTQYPHEVSGGMKQRIALAIALSVQPVLLIADEPTTALDATTQAHMLKLIKSFQKENGMALMLITHDLGIAAEHADKIVVMYAGEIVESGPSREVLNHPNHPYTEGLIKSKKSLKEGIDFPLYSLEGNPPNLEKERKGCAFAPRCKFALEKCKNESPRDTRIDRQTFKCWNPL